jgi:hypothetical protein
MSAHKDSGASWRRNARPDDDVVVELRLGAPQSIGLCSASQAPRQRPFAFAATRIDCIDVEQDL